MNHRSPWQLGRSSWRLGRYILKRCSFFSMMLGRLSSSMIRTRRSSSLKLRTLLVFSGWMGRPFLRICIKFMIPMEHFFTTYVRTKTVFNHRFKHLKDYGTVKIYVYELKKLGVNNGPLLYQLRANGEIWYDKDGNFKALRKGPIDPVLLERTKKRPKIKAPLTTLHKWMRDQLMQVELDGDCEDVSVYFKAFLDLRHEQLDAFFTVDAFSGRVHSPVVNLKHELRKSLRFYGKPLVSLDVKQMQPTILAKVLLDSVGENSFSTAIFNGEDVYEILQRNAGLSTRPEAKKFLFQLIFGKPMDDIGKMFIGETKWVDWINGYKSKTEEKNPHKGDKHTNLAWLMQFSEVRVMTGIWQRLMDEGIPFLSIHDELLCRKFDKDVAYSIMHEELSKHFRRFSISVNHDL